MGPRSHANASRHSALSYEHAGAVEAQLELEVAELLAKAEAADQADVPDGMSIPEELTRREIRLAKLGEARATIKARARERLSASGPSIRRSSRRGTRRWRQRVASLAASRLSRPSRAHCPRIRSI